MSKEPWDQFSDVNLEPEDHKYLRWMKSNADIQIEMYSAARAYIFVATHWKPIATLIGSMVALGFYLSRGGFGL